MNRAEEQVQSGTGTGGGGLFGGSGRPWGGAADRRRRPPAAGRHYPVKGDSKGALRELKGSWGGLLEGHLLSF